MKPGDDAHKRETITIRAASEILNLMSLPRRRRKRIQVALALSSISGNEKKNHEKRLNKLVNACGCAEGAAGALLLPTITGLLLSLSARTWTPKVLILTILALFLAFVLGGILGKWAGLNAARERLKRLTKKLFDLYSGGVETVK
jgi:hypothetical protein